MKLIEKELLNLEKCFLRTKYLVTGTNVLSSSISAATIFFLTTLALAYTNKGPSVESSGPVGIMEAIPEGTFQEDDSIVIPDEESNGETDSGASKIPD